MEQTVTVYRLWDGKVFRQVLEGCYLHMQKALEPQFDGDQQRVDFLLIVPGPLQQVLPGDLVYEGVGPVITVQEWPRFIPAAVEGLVQAQYVQPMYLGGKLHHTEAGTLRKVWR